MASRALALALVAACVGFAAWVYYRDWESPSSPTAERTQAEFDARRVATALGHGDRCRACGVQLLGRTSPRHWMLRIRGRAGTRCFELALDDFAVTAHAGLAGVKARSCPLERPAGRARSGPRT